MRLALTSIFILCFSITFSQDKLTKIDGTSLNVKIIEVGADSITYTLSDSPNMLTQVKPKSNFTRADYSNGSFDLFPFAPKLLSIPKTPSSNNSKLSDWIKFSVDAGAVYSKSYIGVPYNKDNDVNHTNGDAYEKNDNSDKSQITGQFGLNFLFGKSKNVKHIIGASYLYMRSEYDKFSGMGFAKEYPIPGYYYSQMKEVSVSAKYHIVCFNTGANFRLSDEWSISCLGSFGFTAHSSLVSNGTLTNYTTESHISGPGTNTTYTVSKVENEHSVDNSPSYLLIQAKLNYDFKVKNTLMGIYVSGHFSAVNRLPYCSVGFTLYPFKKLSPAGL